MTPLTEAFDRLASRRVLLFGGKGGVGKTTIAVAAALHFSSAKPTTLFTTDPASNLDDLLGDLPAKERARLRIENLDASGLYRRFLDANLDALLEIGDRGTYLDREEMQRLFELSLPGIDELMSWLRIGELAEEDPEAMLVVDTAPTGHTLRMLASSDHFRQLTIALDTMQEKHRAMVRQFMRRDVRDALDAFINDFEQKGRARRELLADPARSAFVAVTLSESLVVEQTRRLIGDVAPVDVPFVILNRAVEDADCARDRERMQLDDAACAALRPTDVVKAGRACVPLDSARRIAEWSRARKPGPSRSAKVTASEAPVGGAGPLNLTRLLFVAGKGGVGKTTCGTSVALQLARRNPEQRYVIVSVDPAHSLRDLFAGKEPPVNLSVETIDTRKEWREFRDSIGEKVVEVFDTLTPRGMTLGHDREAMQQLIEIAPPGADEIFAIVRLSDLVADDGLAGIIVDTAPTGHFLRLLDLPASAREWLREFMRILLRYRELIPPGSLGESLVRASKSLKELDDTLTSDRCAVLVVTRPERIVVAESKRLIDDLRRRGIAVGGVIGNYLTPENDCRCDRSMRRHEIRQLSELDVTVAIERRDSPPVTLDELAALVPMAG